MQHHAALESTLMVAMDTALVARQPDSAQVARQTLLDGGREGYSERPVLYGQM